MKFKHYFLGFFLFVCFLDYNQSYHLSNIIFIIFQILKKVN